MEILFVDFAPFFARPLSIFSNEKVSWRGEVRLDRGITDWRLVVELPSLVEELLLVLGSCVHRGTINAPCPAAQNPYLVGTLDRYTRNSCYFAQCLLFLHKLTSEVDDSESARHRNPLEV